MTSLLKLTRPDGRLVFVNPLQIVSVFLDNLKTNTVVHTTSGQIIVTEQPHEVSRKFTALTVES